MGRSVLADSVGTIATKFAARAANLLVFAVLAHKLSLSEFGIYGYVATMSLLITTALDFGTRHSIGYYLPRSPGLEQAIRLQALVWAAVLSCSGAVGFYYFLKLLVPEFSSPSILLPASLVVPGMLCIRIEQGVLLGQGRIKEYNASETWPRSLLLLGTFGTLALGVITVEVALWTLAASYNLAAIRVVAMNPMRRSPGLPSADLYRSFFRILKRGAIYFPGIVLMVASKRVNAVIVQDMLGSEAMGVFYGVTRLSEVFSEVALAVGVALFSHNARNANSQSAILETAKVARISMTFLAIASLFAIAFAPLIVRLMLGAEYAEYNNVFRVAVISTLVGALWNMMMPVLYTSDRPMLGFWLFLPGVTLNLVLSLIGVRYYGIAGAVYALLASQVVVSAGYMVACNRIYGLRPTSILVVSRAELAELAGKVTGRITRRLPRKKKDG